MPERTSRAFMLSLLLHAAAVAIVIALAFAAQQRKAPPAMIFELVAGPGNDYAATRAPARGTPGGNDMKFKIPEPPGHVTPIPVEPPAPAPTERVTRPETKAPSREKARPTEKSSSSARMTYEQYVKEHGLPKASKGGETRGPRPIRVPRISTRGIIDGVEGGSSESTRGSGGTALQAAIHSEMDAYVSRLVTALKQNHEKPPGMSDLLSTEVEFLVAADGTISRGRIIRSSGNRAFDESCLEALRRVGSGGPRPDGKSDKFEFTFQMKDE